MLDGYNPTTDRASSRQHEPVAIVGMGLRFPGGNDTPEGFEEFLAAGGDGIVPLPTDRWDLTGFLPEPGLEPAPGTIRAPAAGFLRDIDQFDPGFFNISPREANYIDPQQRILLETAWQALENANIDPASLRHGNGGVYIGASSIDYALELDSMPYEELDPALSNGITIYPLSGRLSYFLGWRGPSLSTDTACASSLTALHLAARGLINRECDIALAGAVNCLHHPRIWVMFSHGEVFAADGRCKTFDDAADGYARAEGCGVVVLKRLSDARRDGDTVLALLRGTAIGQDGESAGLTAPNGTAQEAVMRAALADAGLTPADIQYVEAHGTGTPLGDPIEMGSINGVFGDTHTKHRPLVVGSLKANIGHMEPAAGIGGVVKTVLQMRGGRYFPHRVSVPSKRIPWETYPVVLAQGGADWNAPVRRALVNGFGFAGAIGAAVLEQAPDPTAEAGAAVDRASGSKAGAQIFTASAKSPRALRLQLDHFRGFLDARPDTEIAEFCYTGNVGRSHFPHRVAGVVHDRADLYALLERESGRAGGPTAGAGAIRKTAFLFSGSGAQQPGMGAGLYDQFPVFREHVDACDRTFAPLTGRSIRDLMLGRAEDPERFHEVRYNQPIMFMFEYSLARLWMSWGVRPNALVGHSTGEVIAAAVAGLFSVQDAARLMAARGALMETLTVPGAMAAVAAETEQIEPILAPYRDLGIGAVNSPGQCVLSGGRESLERACADLRDRGYQVTALDVPVASHSPLMLEIADRLREVLEGITYREPRLTLVSGVTGEVARPAELSDPDYWIRHLCAKLDFAAAMRTVERRGRHVFIEIGPSTSLTTPAAQCVAAERHVWLASAHPEDGTADTIRQALAEYYLAGLPVDWRAVHAGRERARVRLPNYVFDRRRYWLPNDATRHGRAVGLGAQQPAHPLLGRPVAPSIPGTAHEYSTLVSARNPGYLAEHTAGGRPFYPVAAYVEALLALQDAVYGETRRTIRAMAFHETLFLPDAGAVELRTRLTADGAVEMAAVTAQGERTLLTAQLGAPGVDDEVAAELRTDAMPQPGQRIGSDAIYAVYERLGLDYGPRFRRLRWAGPVPGGLIVGEVAGISAGAIEFLPPALMDAATHTLAATLDGSTGYVAVRCGSFRLFKKPKSDTLHAVLGIGPADGPDAEFTAALMLKEEDGQPVFAMEGLAFTRLSAADLSRGDAEALDEAQLEGLMAGPRRERLDRFETVVRTALAKVLQIDDVDSVDNRTRFVLLGLNSLLAAQLRTILERAVGTTMPAPAVLQHPSVELLAEYLDRRLAEDLDG